MFIFCMLLNFLVAGLFSSSLFTRSCLIFAHLFTTWFTFPPPMTSIITYIPFFWFFKFSFSFVCLYCNHPLFLQTMDHFHTLFICAVSSFNSTSNVYSKVSITSFFIQNIFSFFHCLSQFIVYKRSINWSCALYFIIKLDYFGLPTIHIIFLGVNTYIWRFLVFYFIIVFKRNYSYTFFW